MAAHLVLLAEAVDRPGNTILKAAVTEFGDGDLRRGVQLLRSTSTMLLAEDPAVIDEHEAFAVELSERGSRRAMVSEELTGRLHAIAAMVAQRTAAPSEDHPVSKPHLSAEGMNADDVRRAVYLLDTAFVADAAVRRWGDVGAEVPGSEDADEDDVD